MATTHLLNAAMMPAADGTYTSIEVTAYEFAKLARHANKRQKLVSYIGYKQTAEILSELCGFEIVESRKETKIEDGDILLIARIRYRLARRPSADAKPKLDELEFRIVHFSEETSGVPAVS